MTNWPSSVRVGVLAVACAAVAGCAPSAEKPLGLPDSFKLFEPVPGAQALASGLVLVREIPADDPRAATLHKLFGDGFGAEILRTHFLAKQLIREAAVGGKTFSAAARRLATEPTIFIVGATKETPGLALPPRFAFLGGPVERKNTAWIALDGDPAKDTALVQTVAGKLGRHIAALVATGAGVAAGTPPVGPPSLLDGYALAMEVIAREWRHGDGPAGRMLPNAGSTLQREQFAAVRGNAFVLGNPPGPPRPSRDLLADPGVAATVLYQMAQSKSIGSRIAPGDFYKPYATDRIPPNVSPAAVLGVFRNFQAKLLGAWGNAVLGGRPPGDIADLVTLYAAAFPSEKPEVIRLYVTATLGATVKKGGVGPFGEPAKALEALPELTALSAEVTLGKRTLRDADMAGPAGSR